MQSNRKSKIEQFIQYDLRIYTVEITAVELLGRHLCTSRFLSKRAVRSNERVAKNGEKGVGDRGAIGLVAYFQV